WHRRRDILTEWISKQEGATSITAVSFEDVWKPSVRNTSLQHYVEQRIFDFWKKKSPNDKLKGLLQILDRGKSLILPQEFGEGLQVRNLFVHPPAFTQPFVKQPEKIPSYLETLEDDWFDAVANSFETIIEALKGKVREISGRLIASNLGNLQLYLSERQNAVLSNFLQNSGQLYKGLQPLL